MIAQYRPDIARVAEETVANLRGLENSLEILRNDLAWLCQSIGQPQAAQFALATARPYAPTFGTSPWAMNATSSIAPFSPFAVANPWGTFPSAWAHAPFATSFPNSAVNPAAFGPSPFPSGQIHPASYAYGVPNLPGAGNPLFAANVVPTYR